MSFSTNAKDELIRLPLEKPCCLLAEIGALTQTTASLGFQGAGRFSLTYRVENAALARRIYTILRRTFEVSPQLQFVQHTRLGGRTSCVLTLDGDDARTLLTALHMMERESDGTYTLKRTSPRLQLTRQCCRRAFLRGMFLGAGSITSPEKDYYLELVTDDEALCQYALRLLEKSGLPAKEHLRKGRHVIYIKNGQIVADLLALMGAPQAMMELENIRITRQVRGNINRASNCDDHNYERMVAAGEEQAERIRQLLLRRSLSSLPPALREMASLRMEHPELSLTDLGQMLDPPVGKSGANHRLQRLLALCDEADLEASQAESDKIQEKPKENF